MLTKCAKAITPGKVQTRTKGVRGALSTNVRDARSRVRFTIRTQTLTSASAATTRITWQLVTFASKKTTWRTTSETTSMNLRTVSNSRRLSQSTVLANIRLTTGQYSLVHLNTTISKRQSAAKSRETPRTVRRWPIFACSSSTLQIHRLASFT